MGFSEHEFGGAGFMRFLKDENNLCNLLAMERNRIGMA